MNIDQKNKFSQKLMESKVFNIDQIDKNIIEIIQREPMLTHTEIAKKVNRSQPTIGMRIRKLEKAGVLKFQAGINVKFRLSGTSNLSILVVSTKLAHLDEIVNHHFRKDPNILEVYMDIITDVTNDFVLPFDFNFESCSLGTAGKCCGKCSA